VHKFRLVTLVTMLAIALGNRVTLAGSGSKMSLKLDFGVNSYPSDRRFSTGYYPGIGGDPAHCDASGSMNYHFDVKFGRSAFGAFCYRALDNVDLELGFGYTSIQMEIVQHENVPHSLVCWITDEYSSFSFNKIKDSDFSYFLFRPGATLFLSSKPGIVPYLGVGLDVMRVTAKGRLDFAIPYVTEDTGRYFLNRRLEDLQLDGSEIAVGLDIESGLEFKATEMLSIVFGFSYTFQFQRPFKDFGALVAAGSSPTAKSTEYYSDGMNIKNIAAVLGVRLQL